MLTSCFALHHAIETLSKEAYLYQNMLYATGTPVATTKKYTATVKLALAVIFFLIELWTLYYMLKYVFATTDPGPGRNLRVILLICFTVPVTILSSTIDPNFASIVTASHRRR